MQELHSVACTASYLQEVCVLDHFMAVQHGQELVAELLLFLGSLLIHGFQLLGMSPRIQCMVAVPAGP